MIRAGWLLPAPKGSDVFVSKYREGKACREPDTAPVTMLARIIWVVDEADGILERSSRVEKRSGRTARRGIE